MSFQLRRCGGVSLVFLLWSVGLFAQGVDVALPPVHPNDGVFDPSAPQLYGIDGGGSVELGQQVTLTAVFYGEGADQTYAWRKGEAVIPGATASSYVIQAAASADAGTYSVTVTNSAGSSVASTDLTVKPAAPPVVVGSPSSLVRNVGQEARFSYAATGSYPRTHQWRKNGVDLPGATEATYAIAAVTTADAGTYSVEIANSLGLATTAGASLTVNAAVPPVIASIYPYDQSVTAGIAVSFWVYTSSGSSPYTYQWFKNGSPIAGATSSQYSLEIVQLADAGKYSVRVTNVAGSATSREATLWVTPAIPPTFYSPPESLSIYEGQSVSFSGSAAGSSPIRYQWLRDGSPIDGATSSFFSIQAAKRSDAGDYSVVATNYAGSVTSAVAVLVVNPAVLPKIEVQPASRTLAYGDYHTLSVQVSGSSPFTYQWKKDGVALTYGGNSSYSISNVTPANSGSYTVVVTNAAGSVTSAGATITVQPAVAPSITRQPEGKTVAYGNSFSLSVTAAGSPNLTYEWRKDGLPLGSSGTSFYVSNATPANSGVYTVVVTNSAGSVTSQGATITVQPAIAPTITQQPAGRTAAYGSYITLSVEVTGSSPLSYQWKKDGVAVGGSSSSYSISDATPLHSGVYTVVITNVAGTVTSQSATITIQPAVAPAISVQPVGRTVPFGNSFELSVQASGSPQLRYEWKKDGAAISASGSNYYVSRATTAHSGVYSVTVTNPAGTVTSQAVTVTVQPAIAPTITAQPQSQTVAFNGTVQLSVTAAGSPPLNFQWSKNGVAFSSGSTSSSLSFWSATPADGGIYSVVVSNAAGSVTSANATVTVNAAVPATITRQPESAEVAVGFSASFSAQVDARGAGSLTYQWRRNGAAIADATSSQYIISSVKDTDAGDYTFVVTGPGGTVTSQAAILTVLPLAPPRISSSSLSFDLAVSLGRQLSLNPGGFTGSPPLTYQWSRNGVAISGATSSHYSASNVTVSDLGTYLLTASNAAGLATSAPIEVRLSLTSAATPWVAAAQMGDIVYFLATVPGRMERFDLAAERWLPTVLLSDTRVPTAFAPTSEGIYVAYGRALVRWSLDLRTETWVGDVWRPISLLYVYGDFIYHTGTGSNGPDYGSFNRTSLKSGPSSLPGFIGLPVTTVRQVAFAASLNKGFYWSSASWPSEIYTFSVAADGAFRSFVTSSMNDAWARASRTFVLPGDQMVADDAGTVFSTADLKFAGSFADGFHDLAFLSDHTPVVLRHDALSLAEATKFTESSRVALPQPGLRMFTRGTTVFVFGQPTVVGGTYSVTKVAKSAFASDPVTGTAEPPVGRYSIEDAFLGEDDVLHVLSRTLGGMVRWSAKTRALLPTIQLRKVPTLAFHQPGNARALLVYPDHVIADLPLRASTARERMLGALNLRMGAIVDLGDRVMINAFKSESGGDLRFLLGSGGFVAPQTNQSFNVKAFAWQSTGRRLYSLNTLSSGEIRYDIIPESGDLPTSSTGLTSSLTAPLRFNPEETLAVTGNGRVVNADLQQVGALANDIADAAWLPDGLYTLRSRRGRAEIQQWTRSTYLLKSSLPLDGVPVRIFRLSDTQMAVVTMVQGMAAFTVVNAGLSISTSPVSTIQVSAQPQSQAVLPADSVSFSAAQQGGSGTVSYQWLRNGTALSGAVSSSYTVANIAPASAGLYSARISDATNTTFTDPAILGVSTTQKVIGTGTELAGDIVHPNGKSYDQILPSGAAVSVTADHDQVVRTSFIDMNDDIVQVEFSGAGTLSIVLSGASTPAAPVNYNQPTVRYVKGHAGIVISGADETTHVSVFSIGRATAFDPTGAFNMLQPIGAANDPIRNGSPLFAGHASTAYDGIADLAYIAILSNNGKFGGIRAANANFFASTGLTGIYAPGVQFTGPVYFGSLDAFGDANPTLVLGSASDIRVTGGDLQQTNSRAIKVAGVSQVKFVDGTTSHGTALPARQNRARFDQNGVDVTAQIVVNPVP